MTIKKRTLFTATDGRNQTERYVSAPTDQGRGSSTELGAKLARAGYPLSHFCNAGMTPEERVATAEALNRMSVEEIQAVGALAANITPLQFLEQRAAQRLGAMFG